ncbi:hypothetical protein Taro_033970 [Colocasia esculenta]|uniref:Filament-like plant protein 4 n=1 Tax=Colocasia esculenta TaxID=4460 RepID=A0A843VV91_COLES|nr:hypothetical protein [Colocasia esculenta]
MDRRSWPWKRKSSDKSVAAADSANAVGSVENQGNEDNSKSINYVQVSKETYAHFTELEDEVKVLNDQLNSLNEKLSTAQADMLTKDTLVKQHAKVAEEAVSGWEKAEAEALALKNQLESVTLQRLTAEERAAHLDGALKECMKQIRIVKEDSEQKLHDVVFAKTKQWEKIKFELDSKIYDLGQELLGASAENAALSRSLHERSNVLMKISEEKSRAEAEIEILKTNLQSCEKEISSLKYEGHIVSKELEIRNEEKNMSVRSADVANKQHLEDVKKITKLEAECQRLRGLVRKKLPGPAALAQMKQEVESLGRDHVESRLRRSPGKTPSGNLGPVHDFAFENFQQCHKENEFLTARLLAMEEETKMLKEALSKRNSELQASRNVCAKTASKLRSFEAQMLVLNQQRSPTKCNLEIDIEGSLSQNGSDPPSLTSMSEDGIDDQGSCTESWATALMSELSHFKREKDVDKAERANTSHQLELMHDFLEMERLACMSAESNGTVATADGVMAMRNVEGNALVEVLKDVDSRKEQQPDLGTPRNLTCSNEDKSSGRLVSQRSTFSLSTLHSRITSVIEAQTKNYDVETLLQHMRRILHDIQEEIPQQSVSCIIEDASALDDKHCPEDVGETIDSVVSLPHVSYSCTDTKSSIDENIKSAISNIRNFVTSLCKKAMEVQRTPVDCHQISQKVGEFSNCVDSVLCSETGLDSFITGLSSILSESKEFTFGMLGNRDNEGESNNSDCIDKVALLDSKVEPEKESFSAQCTTTNSASEPEILQIGHANPGFELEHTIIKCSSEEIEKLKLEKDALQVEFDECACNLEQANIQLQEVEKQLAELMLKFTASQKSNSLAETQLKCMTESYKSLESCTQELETETNLLRAKVESLDNELQEERRSHQGDLVKWKDLQEQLERNQKCSMCTFASDNSMDEKTKHVKMDREIAAAAEKLAECQETIILLGRQLKALHPQTELVSYPNNGFQMNEDVQEDMLIRSGSNGGGRNSFQLTDHAEKDNIASILQKTGGESPLDAYSPLFSPSDNADPEASPITRSPVSSKRPKHRSSMSSSSPASPNTTPEKHGRGFSRFFAKGKSVQ